MATVFFTGMKGPYAVQKMNEAWDMASGGGVSDPELLAIAGLASAADQLPYFTGTGTAALTTLSGYARTLLDDGDAATARGTLGLGTAATLAFDVDGALAADSDLRIATQKAVRTYVASVIASLDVQVFKGLIDCSANPNYPAADAGWTYRVSVAGKIGGAAGPNVTANDMLICLVDGTAAGNHATVGANWGRIQGDLDGAVTTADIGVNVQAYDAELAAIAGLVSAADKLPYFTGVGAAALATLTAFSRTLLDDADAATARATLGVPATGLITGSGLTLGSGKLAGRYSAGTGALEAITIGAGLSIDGAGNLTAPGGGGGSGANLAATLSATEIIVTSDTGTDATLPAADGVNAGLMVPAQVGAVAALGTASTLAYDTDTTFSADSDLRVPTQKATKAYVAAYIAALDVQVFKGLIDCSANPNYPAADAGWTYRVSVAGKIGGAAGLNVTPNDMLICLVDGTAAGNHATVGVNWGRVQGDLDGAVTTADIGVNVQAYDADLAALAGLVSAADKLPYFTGAGAAALTTLTAFIRTLLDDVDAAAARGTLGAAASGANTDITSLTGADGSVSRFMFKDTGMTYLDKGNSGVALQTLDYTAGSHQKITVTGNHTIATSNWPPAGNLGELLLELVNGAAFTITWPTINWVKSDGSTTTTFASNGVTLQTAGTDWVLLWSRDAGATIYGKVMR